MSESVAGSGSSSCAAPGGLLRRCTRGSGGAGGVQPRGQLGAKLTSMSRWCAALGTSGARYDRAGHGTYAGSWSAIGRRPGLLIVFSDGVDTSSWLRADAVLDAARRADVVVYGVSVVSRLGRVSPRATTLTRRRLFEIEKTANLASTFQASSTSSATGISSATRRRVSPTDGNARRAREESAGDDQGASVISQARRPASRRSTKP